MIITDVTFYFGNQQVDEAGTPLSGLPPESHTLTWSEIQSNAGFSLSTGESMFTEMLATEHHLRVVNGFYFGSGKYGSLLAIRYNYEDGSKGWVKQVDYAATASENMALLEGNWIDGLTYEEVIVQPQWTGKPLIGYENDYVDVFIERLLPSLEVSLSPVEGTALEGEILELSYSSVNYCSGSVIYSWDFDSSLITPLTDDGAAKTFSFNQQGTYIINLTATNDCGQVTTASSSISVVQQAVDCDLSLTPSTISIILGDTATFEALHPYTGTGTWTYDPSLEVIAESAKTLTVKPVIASEYSIAYEVNSCLERATLHALPVPEGEFEVPVEPAPPALPDTPPESGGQVGLIIELADASRPIPPLYKYPNIMKRNSRYRGQRESEKVLHDHQEQIFDLRQLYRDADQTNVMKGITIRSWFYGSENSSIPMKSQENSQTFAINPDNPGQMTLDTESYSNSPVLQLSGNNLEENMVGIYGIKRRMQELDERIAEGERRYREYENAYE